MSDGLPIVEWEGVSYSYPGARALALQPTSLSIWSGEHVAVVGRSGSGKSTLLSLIGLLEQPRDGAYRLSGSETVGVPERIRADWRASQIGFIFQGFHLIEGDDVLSNVSLGLRYMNSGRAAARSRSLAALEEVGIADRHADKPSALSGGERQRVAIARAIVKEPSILLADEPTGNLDSMTSAGIMTLFEKLRLSKKLTLLMVTHNMELASQADRCLRVSDGHVSGSSPGT